MTTKQPIQVNALNYWVLGIKDSKPSYYRTITEAKTAAEHRARQQTEADYGMVSPDTFGHKRLGTVDFN